MVMRMMLFAAYFFLNRIFAGSSSTDCLYISSRVMLHVGREKLLSRSRSMVLQLWLFFCMYIEVLKSFAIKYFQARFYLCIVVGGTSQAPSIHHARVRRTK